MDCGGNCDLILTLMNCNSAIWTSHPQYPEQNRHNPCHGCKPATLHLGRDVNRGSFSEASGDRAPRVQQQFAQACLHTHFDHIEVKYHSSVGLCNEYMYIYSLLTCKAEKGLAPSSHDIDFSHGLEKKKLGMV